MENILNEVETFSQESNIEFSTEPDPSKSKSKLISVCGRQPSLAKPGQLVSPWLGSLLPRISATSYSSLGIWSMTSWWREQSWLASQWRCVTPSPLPCHPECPADLLLLLLRESGWLGAGGGRCPEILWGFCFLFLQTVWYPIIAAFLRHTSVIFWITLIFLISSNWTCVNFKYSPTPGKFT